MARDAQENVLCSICGQAVTGLAKHRSCIIAAKDNLACKFCGKYHHPFEDCDDLEKSNYDRMIRVSRYGKKLAPAQEEEIRNFHNMIIAPIGELKNYFSKKGLTY